MAFPSNCRGVGSGYMRLGADCVMHVGGLRHVVPNPHPTHTHTENFGFQVLEASMITAASITIITEHRACKFYTKPPMNSLLPT